MSGRFLHAEKCTTDVLMIAGSSVALESAFSDSKEIANNKRRIHERTHEVAGLITSIRYAGMKNK